VIADIPECLRSQRPSNSSPTVSSLPQYLPALRTGARWIYPREDVVLQRFAAQGARRRWTRYSSDLQIYRITSGDSWSQRALAKRYLRVGTTAWKAVVIAFCAAFVLQTHPCPGVISSSSAPCWLQAPDASSIKIIRRATVSCDGGACSALLLPLEAIKP